MRRRTAQSDGILVVPALVAFVLAVAVDWNWQIGAFMVAGTTLAAVPLSRPSAAHARASESRKLHAHGRRFLAATGLGLAAVGSIVVLALALVAPQSVQASREALARNDQRAAAMEAARGESAAGFAASPALQRALVAEEAGDLAGAEAAARRAAERTPGDWRPWFLIARLATAQGDEREAIAAFRRAKALNPESGLLR
jgi:tetratricopeptide (TPR) repeat protein